MEKFVNSLVSFGERWFMTRGWRHKVTIIVSAAAFFGFHLAALLSHGIPRTFLAADFFFILLAAGCLGTWGALAVAVLSGLAAGPLLPFFAAPGESGEIFWIFRFFVFALFGLLAGVGSAIFRYQIQKEKETNERFVHAQKMEAIGRLTGAVSHDFNNMLTAIGGYAQLLLSSAKSESDVTSLARELLEVVSRSSSVTHQLLALSRKGTTEPQPIDLEEAIRSLSKMLRRLIGDEIDLQLLLARDSWPVEMDPGQLDQVLMNLAMNAADAMPGGGRLTIRTERLVVDRILASQHPDLKLGDHVMITVTDSGSGIGHDAAGKVFEPFFTTKEVGKGTGLGLYTAYGIVKRSRGDIWFTSDPRHGTSFRICLPRARAEEPREPLNVRAPRGGAETVDATIVVAEGDADVRAVMMRLLEGAGYRVILADDGEHARQLIEEDGEGVDLVITDLMMPRFAGLDVIKTISRLRPSIGIIVTSGRGKDDHGDSEITTLTDGFLEKPFTGDHLLKMVRQILR